MVSPLTFLEDCKLPIKGISKYVKFPERESIHFHVRQNLKLFEITVSTHPFERVFRIHALNVHSLERCHL